MHQNFYSANVTTSANSAVRDVTISFLKFPRDFIDLNEKFFCNVRRREYNASISRIPSGNKFLIAQMRV